MQYLETKVRDLKPLEQLSVTLHVLMSKEFSSLTDKDLERPPPDYLQDPDFPDYSLPSGLSWSSDHDRDRSQEECIRNIPMRLSPRLLLTLASSPSMSPASRQAAYTQDYTPEQLKVGYQVVRQQVL